MEMNNSLLQFNLKQIYTDVEIYNKNISLLAYKTYILTDTNQCVHGNYGVCLLNNYSVHCEKILINSYDKGNVIPLLFVI